MQYITNFIEYFYPSTTSSLPQNKRNILNEEISKFDRESLRKAKPRNSVDYSDSELKRLLGEKFKNALNDD